MIRVGDLIETMDAAGNRGGDSGIVRSLHRGMAIIDRVEIGDSGELRSLDRPLKIDAGRLAKVPTRGEIRQATTHLRAAHLAKLKPERGIKQGNIRQYPGTIFGPNPPK